MRKSKLFALVLCGVLCAGITACGESEERDSSDNHKTAGQDTGNQNEIASLTSGNDNLDGDYIPLEHAQLDFFGDQANQNMIDNLDGAIQKTIDQYLQETADHEDYKGSGYLYLTGDQFRLSEIEFGNNRYTGSFQTNGNKLLFHYETLTEKLGTDEELTYTFEEQGGDTIDPIQAKLQIMNETEYLHCDWAPLVDQVKNSRQMGMYPDYYFDGVLLNGIQLYHVDELLCRETYGFKINGAYQAGESFTISYNLKDTLRDNPVSRAAVDNDPNTLEEMVADYMQLLYLGLSDTDEVKNPQTEIQFSDGKWEWYTVEHDLINNGEYQESKRYPGLIEMYHTSDSRMSADTNYAYTNLPPLMFYIASDGNIYYPCYIKAE